MHSCPICHQSKDPSIDIVYDDDAEVFKIYCCATTVSGPTIDEVIEVWGWFANAPVFPELKD